MDAFNGQFEYIFIDRYISQFENVVFIESRSNCYRFLVFIQLSSRFSICLMVKQEHLFQFSKITRNNLLIIIDFI